jgi:hypothetical protein
MFDISPVVVVFVNTISNYIKNGVGKMAPQRFLQFRKGGSILIDRDNRSQSIKEDNGFW